MISCCIIVKFSGSMREDKIPPTSDLKNQQESNDATWAMIAAMIISTIGYFPKFKNNYIN